MQFHDLNALSSDPDKAQRVADADLDGHEDCEDFEDCYPPWERQYDSSELDSEGDPKPWVGVEDYPG